MKVSFNQTLSPNVKDNNGYGYAAKMCKESLISLGHEVSWRDSAADVEINFIQPEQWYWSGPYRIAYLPWESTELRPGWVESLNSCDEVWTPSPVVAQWMRDAGVTKDVRVYQHGVDGIWTPQKREFTSGRWMILHHGAEALRKGGNDAIEAFLATLSDEPATLVMKMLLNSWAVHDTKHIKLFGKKVPIEELVQIYHDCHAMVYPSYGEGFSLVPLQAMATGMPVLVTRGWAPYEYLIPDDLLIDSHLIDSPWPDHHPGKVFKPHQDDLQEKMRSLYDNYDKWAESAYELASIVHRDYNWKNLTEQAFAHLN
jgi:glycosyltransferase involved in cell wall biosynthesis